MNQMQQMLQQANRMQREMEKAHAELANRTFEKEKGGMVKVVLKGDKTIESIDIDKDALDPDNKEVLEEAIKMAISETIEEIQKAADEIDERITGRSGLPF